MYIDHSPRWTNRWLAICIPLALSALPLAAAAAGTGPSTGMETNMMWMTAGQQRFAITLEDNPATQALTARLPLTLEMSDLNDNEKHVTLQAPLPTQTYRPGTIHNGDLLLYGNDVLVVFYKTFNSSYTYTRLGRIDNPAGLSQALGRDAVRLTFSAR